MRFSHTTTLHTIQSHSHNWVQHKIFFLFLLFEEIKSPTMCLIILITLITLFKKRSSTKGSFSLLLTFFGYVCDVLPAFCYFDWGDDESTAEKCFVYVTIQTTLLKNEWIYKVKCNLIDVWMRNIAEAFLYFFESKTAWNEERKLSYGSN